MAKAGAVGPVRLPGLGGVYATILFIVIAPVVDSALPSMLAPALILIAPLCAIIVPFIVVDAAMFTTPSTFQNTFAALAPFINLTRADACTSNGPCI